MTERETIKKVVLALAEPELEHMREQIQIEKRSFNVKTLEFKVKEGGGFG